MGLKICQFQIHTGFIPEEETVMRLSRNHLDELAEVDLYGPNFLVSLNFFVLDQERTVQPEPWGKCLFFWPGLFSEFTLSTISYC